jgi:hypothetical protein
VQILFYNWIAINYTIQSRIIKTDEASGSFSGQRKPKKSE